MKKLKLALAGLAFVMAAVLPGVRLIKDTSVLGWAVQPVVTFACDPQAGSGCGGGGPY